MTATETSAAVTIPGSRVLPVKSSVLDSDLEVQVVRLGGMGPPSEALLPAIYLLDAAVTFPLAYGAAFTMALAQELPAHLLVGIGYPPETGLMELGARRMLDLTPTRDERWEQKQAAIAPIAMKSGGAPAFLESLRTEVIPLVEGEFAADPEQRVLYGHSLGGLVTLYALFEHRDLFRGYVATSPSLWWDDRYVFQREAAHAAANEDLSASLFLSVGARESTPRAGANEAQRAATAKSRMVDNMTELAATLEGRAYPSLQLESHLFRDETHVSVMPASLTRGLRSVLGAGVPTD